MYIVLFPSDSNLTGCWEFYFLKSFSHCKILNIGPKTSYHCQSRMTAWLRDKMNLEKANVLFGGFVCKHDRCFAKFGYVSYV